MEDVLDSTVVELELEQSFIEGSFGVLSMSYLYFLLSYTLYLILGQNQGVTHAGEQRL